jgi:hypothetical protein
MPLFKSKSKSAPLSREEALACVPIRNTATRETRLSSGDVMIAYPQNMRPWARALLRRFGKDGTANAPIKKLQLDQLGSGVWDLIDGRRTVRQIATSFARTHRMPYREAESSVTQFLRELGKRGVIGMKWKPGK